MKNKKTYLFHSISKLLKKTSKQAFVSHLDQLFNADVLFGSGLTVKENLRPLGYHVIAELVHQLRGLLPYSTLKSATYAFLTNLHDDTLPLQVHAFSAKLIAVALADCIRAKGTEGTGMGNFYKKNLRRRKLKF